MKNFWMILFCVLFCTSALAQNQSGLYADPERDGEGAAIFEQVRLDNDNVIQATIFTYINRCNNRAYDAEGDLLQELQNFTYTIVVDEEEVLVRLVDRVRGLRNYHHCRKIQAWFITGNHPLSGGQAVGPIYITDPFEVLVDGTLAEVDDVGLFVIRENGNGFNLEVLQTGNALDEDSELYMRTYRWEYLFGPTLKAPE